MAGGNSGASIIAGNGLNSLLWKRINDGSMPPSSNDVSIANVELVKRWINEGAQEKLKTTIASIDVKKLNRNFKGCVIVSLKMFRTSSSDATNHPISLW